MKNTVSVCIPTFKSYELLKPYIGEIMSMLSSIDIKYDYNVYASCEKQSAAKNRNQCINKTDGDIILMIDDDLDGFTTEWFNNLIDTLVNNPQYSIVSSRTTDKSGNNNGLLGDCGDPKEYGDIQKALHTKETGLQLVASACIAFRRSDIEHIRDELNKPFDENYKGAVWEDSDFCMVMRHTLDHKDIVICNTSKIVHLNAQQGRTHSDVMENRNYFNSKWSVSL